MEFAAGTTMPPKLRAIAARPSRRRLERLARQYGTPLVVLDLNRVERAIAELRKACEPHGVRIAYAAKAFICVRFAAYLAKRGIDLDVCSLGELKTAERAGVPAVSMTLHGAGKTLEELEAAAAGRTGCIVVDGLDELHRLAEIAGTAGCRATVLLRTNTLVDTPAHAHVRTVGEDTKFGLHPRDEAEAAAILARHPGLRFAGVHGHLGSQIALDGAFELHAQALVDAAARLSLRGLHSEKIILGGGFPVPTRRRREVVPPAFSSLIAAVVERVRARCAYHGIETQELGIEPGRAIVADAGTTLYRVVAVKGRGSRSFAIVDGGMTDNPRPALYGAAHDAYALEARTNERADFTLCGRACENDELGRVQLPADLRSGDVVAMRVTGAYTYSMASNYNRFPRPAVVAIEGPRAIPYVRRELPEETLRSDVPLDSSTSVEEARLHRGAFDERGDA